VAGAASAVTRWRRMSPHGFAFVSGVPVDGDGGFLPVMFLLLHTLE
jgi:hypothetical protein